LFKLCEDRFRNALRLLKRGQINAPEYAGDDQSYIRSPRNAACQQGFGRVLHTQVVFEYDWINCMRHFIYFAELDVMHMPLTFEHGLSFIAALTKEMRGNSQLAKRIGALSPLHVI
jgi:hypothetical protein